MSHPEPRREEEDWESEPLLPDYTKDIQDAEAAHLPGKSCRRFVPWKRVIKLGCLLTFGVALFTTTFILIPHWFWSNFKHFGPPEPHNYFVPWRNGMTCKDHAQFWQSEVVEYNRRWSTYTNLTVPLNKDGLLILVKGGIYGSVDFVEDDSLVNEAYVHFYIEFGETVIGKTKFCTLEYPHDNRSGVGIFGPKHPGGKGTMVKVTVYLPKFEAPKLDRMDIIVPDMEVNFPSDFKIKSKFLSVTSKNAPLHASNAECLTCDLNVSDGPIRGNFTVRDGLVLKTQSGAINANITMISNSTGAYGYGGPNVDITTSTGSINANFALVVVNPETGKKVSSGGVYQIATRSHHAPVRLEVVDGPVDSTLVLSSKNTRGRLEAFLHPTFQGSFSSEALIGDTPLGIRGYTGNPSGNDRKRNLVWGGWSIPPGIRHIMSGEVWWGDRPGPPYLDGPPSLIFSSVQLKSIIGQPLISLHLSNPNATSVSTD